MNMPKAVWQDSDILPPQEGLISQVTLVAATASAAQDTGIDGSTVAKRSAFVSLCGTAEWYIAFSSDGAATVTTPVVATATCFGPYAAGVVVPFRVNPLQRYFMAISTPGGILKWYVSSGNGE